MLLASSDPLYIGCELQVDWQYFAGRIDDVRIYDRKLTEEEMLVLYEVYE